MKHIADAGSLAEEVISTVRTAQAFGTQATLARLYDKHVNSSLAVDAKVAIRRALSPATFMFVMYSGYGLS